MGSVVFSSIPVEPSKMSTAGFKFWEDGISDIQQKAKSMSQQFLDSSPVADNSSLSGITSWLERMTNQAANRQDSLYQRELDDSRQWAKDSRNVSWNDNERRFEQQMALLKQQQAGGSGRGLLNGGSTSNGSSFGGSSGGFATPNYDYMNFQNDLERRLIKARGDSERSIVREQGYNQLSAINAQNDFQSNENRHNRNFTKEQSALDRAFKERDNAAQRASAERLGAMDAQSRMFSAVASSITSGGNNNYQYWGGKV